MAPAATMAMCMRSMPKPFERGCAELLAQAFVGGVEREEPVFHLIVEIVLRQFVDGFCS